MGRDAAGFDANKVGGEPPFERGEPGRVPGQARGKVVRGFERNELLVRAEVDDGRLDFFAIEVRVGTVRRDERAVYERVGPVRGTDEAEG